MLVQARDFIDCEMAQDGTRVIRRVPSPTMVSIVPVAGARPPASGFEADPRGDVIIAALMNACRLLDSLEGPSGSPGFVAGLDGARASMAGAPGGATSDASPLTLHALDLVHLPALERLTRSAPPGAADPAPWHPATGDVRAHVQFAALLRREGRAESFVVHAGDRLVGVAGLHGIEAGSAEVAIWIAAPLRNRGLGRHAIARLIGHAHENRGLASLVARCRADNAASLRIFTGAGFRPRGTRRARIAGRGMGLVVVLTLSLGPDVGAGGGGGGA